MVTPVPLGLQRPSFDAREATVASVQEAIFARVNTCRDVVSAFLSRIEAMNPKINAIITLNANVLDQADALDSQLSANKASGSLFGVPILLKDNFETADMRTTGGCAALRNMQPSADAPTVAALRAAGGLILGKVNLHEMALEGLSVSSLGGQTINPYDLTRTPGGSSGGSGAAIAVSLAVLATGTDTVNSLRSPASANSLFSVRPTRGLISRRGVIPVSHTQDTVGPIGRCVYDVATALTVMAGVGEDTEDAATALCPRSLRGIDYAADLHAVELREVRLGVVTTMFNRTPGPETTPVNVTVDAFLQKLASAGVQLIPITQPVYTSLEILRTCDTQRHEFREVLDAYFARPGLRGQHPPSMTALYTANDAGTDDTLVIPAQYEYIQKALTATTQGPEYQVIQSSIRELTSTLQATFEENKIDALVYPQQQNLVVKIGSASQSGRNGILAAVTGSPVVTIPAGFSDLTEDAPAGVPIGVELLGRPWTEQKLLNLARAIEIMAPIRKAPLWAEEMVEVKRYNGVLTGQPDSGKFDQRAYPIGKIR